jgi:hypothetical protein
VYTNAVAVKKLVVDCRVAGTVGCQAQKANGHWFCVCAPTAHLSLADTEVVLSPDASFVWWLTQPLHGTPARTARTPSWFSKTFVPESVRGCLHEQNSVSKAADMSVYD